jgi:hypothetical protein
VRNDETCTVRLPLTRSIDALNLSTRPSAKRKSSSHVAIHNVPSGARQRAAISVSGRPSFASTWLTTRSLKRTTPLRAVPSHIPPWRSPTIAVTAPFKAVASVAA